MRRRRGDGRNRADIAPRPAWARGLRDGGRELLAEAKEDRISGVAAEVAFFGLLSLFPGLLALAAALGSLSVLIGDEAADDARGTIVSFLERMLTSEASNTVAAVQELFEERSVGLLTFGLVAAVWAMSRGFAAVMDALDIVYDLEERRSWVRRRSLALVFALSTVVVAALLLAMVVVGPLLGTGQEVADRLGLGAGFAAFWTVLRWPFTLAVLFAWATALFHFAPNHHTPWRWDVPGAAVTCAGWIAATLGFRLYLAIAASGNQVLGALGGALIMLVWLYVLGVVLLLGGEVNAMFAARNRVPQPSRG